MPADPVHAWLRDRSFHHLRWDEAFVAARRESVSVCLPARDCAATIAPIVEALAGLRARGAIDEIVVIDGDSRDDTARIAQRAGASVHREGELMPSYGPVLGKGDAMWRALSVLEGDLVCFLDADVFEFSTRYPIGLLGPLIEFTGSGTGDEVSFVKAHYRRPFHHGDAVVTDGGGRVNHLLARPFLAVFHPLLAGVRQPLAGEIAARRALLERLPFTTGYGVELAMLLDVLDAVGLEGMAQVDLDIHHNSHQPVAALSEMSYALLRVLAGRLEAEGRLVELEPAPLISGEREYDAPPVERPPMVSAT
jgi:glucosyl-3-phosphoglycerate synthase